MDFIFMHYRNMEVHMDTPKRIVHYIKGALTRGLHLYPSFTSTRISYTNDDCGGRLSRYLTLNV